MELDWLLRKLTHHQVIQLTALCLDPHGLGRVGPFRVSSYRYNGYISMDQFGTLGSVDQLFDALTWVERLPRHRPMPVPPEEGGPGQIPLKY
jgi:hypothetical protein